jgi:hypothetical protein
VSLQPSANEAARVVKRTRRMLVTAPIQQSQVGGESDQEPQLLNPQVCAEQMRSSIPRIGRLNQCLEQIEGSDLDTNAESEFVTSRKFLDGRQKPHQKLIMGFEGRTGAL